MFRSCVPVRSSITIYCLFPNIIYLSDIKFIYSSDSKYCMFDESIQRIAYTCTMYSNRSFQLLFAQLGVISRFEMDLPKECKHNHNSLINLQKFTKRANIFYFIYKFIFLLKFVVVYCECWCCCCDNKTITLLSHY